MFYQELRREAFNVESRVFKIHVNVKPLNTELNPICHLLALLGAHLIFHVSRIRVKEPDWTNCSEEFLLFCVVALVTSRTTSRVTRVGY